MQLENDTSDCNLTIHETTWMLPNHASYCMYSKCAIRVLPMCCIYSYKCSKEFANDYCFECISIASFQQCRSKVMPHTPISLQKALEPHCGSIFGCILSSQTREGKNLRNCNIYTVQPFHLALGFSLCVLFCVCVCVYRISQKWVHPSHF